MVYGFSVRVQTWACGTGEPSSSQKLPDTPPAHLCGLTGMPLTSTARLIGVPCPCRTFAEIQTSNAFQSSKRSEQTIAEVWQGVLGVSWQPITF